MMNAKKYLPVSHWTNLTALIGKTYGSQVKFATAHETAESAEKYARATAERYGDSEFSHVVEFEIESVLAIKEQFEALRKLRVGDLRNKAVLDRGSKRPEEVRKMAKDALIILILEANHPKSKIEAAFAY